MGVKIHRFFAYASYDFLEHRAILDPSMKGEMSLVFELDQDRPPTEKS